MSGSACGCLLRPKAPMHEGCPHLSLRCKKQFAAPPWPSLAHSGIGSKLRPDQGFQQLPSGCAAGHHFICVATNTGSEFAGEDAGAYIMVERLECRKVVLLPFLTSFPPNTHTWLQ